VGRTLGGPGKRGLFKGKGVRRKEKRGTETYSANFWRSLPDLSRENARKWGRGDSPTIRVKKEGKEGREKLSGSIARVRWPKSKQWVGDLGLMKK